MAWNALGYFTDKARSRQYSKTEQGNWFVKQFVNKLHFYSFAWQRNFVGDYADRKLFSFSQVVRQSSIKRYSVAVLKSLLFY